MSSRAFQANGDCTPWGPKRHAKALGALPEFSDQFIDPCRDVVAKLANFVERALLRIGKVPIDVTACRE
jgi:hypothetical protein